MSLEFMYCIKYRLVLKEHWIDIKKYFRRKGTTTTDLESKIHRIFLRFFNRLGRL